MGRWCLRPGVARHVTKGRCVNNVRREDAKPKSIWQSHTADLHPPEHRRSDTARPNRSPTSRPGECAKPPAKAAPPETDALTMPPDNPSPDRRTRQRRDLQALDRQQVVPRPRLLEHGLTRRAAVQYERPDITGLRIEHHNGLPTKIRARVARRWSVVSCTGCELTTTTWQEALASAFWCRVLVLSLASLP